MKKSFAKLFLLLPLAFSMSLAGCKEKGKSSSSSSGSISSEVTSSSSEGGSTSQGSSTSEGGSSSSDSSSSSSSSSEQPSVVEGMSPEEAISDIASWFGGSAQEVASGVFGTYGAFPAASYSVEDMKGYVSSLFVPEEFELVSDWAEDSGAEVCYYINAVSTVLEIYVYADVVYVKDGAIVEDGTEGAVATDVTCIELYAYTYSE